MPNNNRGRHDVRDFSEGPDYDRDWSHAGPDYDRLHDGNQPHQRTAAEAFGYETRGYPYAGVASEQRRGRFFGRGPKDYRRSDERIREEICDRLTTHPDIDASDMEVRVSDGIVTLTGTAEDRHEKRLAEYIAEDSLGIDDVENLLKVRHGFWAKLAGERVSDRELPTRAEREPSRRSREAGRAESARTAARRDAEAR